MCCKTSTLSEELHKRYLKNVAFGMKDSPIIDSDDFHIRVNEAWEVEVEPIIEWG